MNRQLRSTLYYGLLALLALAYLVPVTCVVSTALRTDANLLRPDQWIPNPITFQRYTSGLYEALPNLARYTFNTLRISILSTVCMLLSCSLAGYALARWRFPLRNLWFYGLLATMTVPGHVTLIPTYVLFRKLGRYDSPWGEIMAGVVLITGPIILLYMLVQRCFVQGITFSGIRG